MSDTPMASRREKTPLLTVLIRLTCALLAMTLILIALSAILALQVTDRNEVIEDMQGSQNQIEREVHDIQSYVDELRAPPTEEDITRQQAITDAVRQVPEVKGILCNQFPENQGCQE